MSTIAADEAADSEYWKDQVARELARLLVNVPAYRNVGDDVHQDPVYDEGPVSDEQLRLVRLSIAFHAGCALVAAAIKQKGPKFGPPTLDLLTRYFRSSGIIYRMRCMKLELEHSSAKGKGIVNLDYVREVWPDHISLWFPPTLREGERREGSRSLEALDRAEIVDVATAFYELGVRCPWFEKILVETLVCAEHYATAKMIRTGQSPETPWTLAVGLAWAYGKSRGGEPKYSTYAAIARLLIGAVKAGTFLGLTLWAGWKYTTTESWQSLLSLVALGALFVGWLGRWIVQRILLWSRPTPVAGLVSAVKGSVMLTALDAIQDVARCVTAPTMSTTLAREFLSRSYEQRAGIDQIVMAYLDRAIASHEYTWASYSRPSMW